MQTKINSQCLINSLKKNQSNNTYALLKKKQNKNVSKINIIVVGENIDSIGIL